MPDVGSAANEHRRATDLQHVEIAAYGNGARRNALIQTVTQIGTLLASFSILVSVVWWASRIDTVQTDTTADVAALTIEVEEAVDERRAMAEHLVRISEVLTKATETLDLTVLRLNDTRDIALGRPSTEPVEP
jgi:hypothetical protein